jgi:hypothetical protein
LTVLGFSSFQQIKDARDAVTKEAKTAENDLTNASGQLKLFRADLDAAKTQIHAKSSEVERATTTAISNVSADSARAHEKTDQLQQEWSEVGGENPYEQFTVSEEANDGRVATGPRGDSVDGVTGYLLLKKAPLRQSIQFYVGNQRLLPRWTYRLEKNVLIIRLRRSGSGETVEVYIQVGYVADKSAGATFHQLVERNGRVFGDGSMELPQFKAPQQY